MKQLHLLGVSPFAPNAVFAADMVLATCRSEAEAVRWSLAYAREFRGMSLRDVAKATGWKSGHSFLSEIAAEESGKRMPPKRVGRFVLATGYRLLEQYRERHKNNRLATGKGTAVDREEFALAAIRADFERMAA